MPAEEEEERPTRQEEEAVEGEEVPLQMDHREQGEEAEEVAEEGQRIRLEPAAEGAGEEEELRQILRSSAEEAVEGLLGLTLGRQVWFAEQGEEAEPFACSLGRGEAPS